MGVDYHMKRTKKAWFLILMIVTILGPYEMFGAERAKHDGLKSTRSIKLAVRRCVFIESRSTSDVLAESYRGTGVILEKNLVLTNAHLLESNREVLVDGKVARVVGQSEKHDLALLFVQTVNLPKVGIDELNKPGQSVFYVGNPSKRRDFVVSGKIVRIDDHYIYTDGFQDIPSPLGASGSGLYSQTGYLIGLIRGVTIVIDTNDPSLSASVPAKKIKAFLRELSRDNGLINWH
jgi:S1-C subfamily serine protease